MKYTVPVKAHATATKANPEQLDVLTGQRSDYELSPDDGIGLNIASERFDDNPFLRMIGIGIRRRPTGEIMRETRGDDSMR